MKIVWLNAANFAEIEDQWTRLKGLGELTAYDDSTGLTEDQLAERIGDADIVVPARMDASLMVKCPNLKYIALSSTGYNTVDLEAAKARGILVSNNPRYGSYSVAQHAMALLMELTNRMAVLDAEVRSGQWAASKKYVATERQLFELDGKTCGIYGFGRIGQNLGRMAKGMGMRVLACDSYPTEEGAAIAEYVDLDTLLIESDVISLHCPLLDSTRNVINKDTIAKMKDGALLLNVARGELIVEEDLAEALRSGKLGGAGLDVTRTEPVNMDNPLFGAPNCYITPHTAWCTPEAKVRMFSQCIDHIEAFISGKPMDIVNR